MRERLRLSVRGAVQGVGFRPFVFWLARDLRLSGWVLNSPQGVTVEVEGPRSALEAFLIRLDRDRPPRAAIHSLEASWLDPAGYDGFEIRQSARGGATTALALPDIATCPECRREIADPGNRRHRYPFTNCTNCGPRFSILEALPYDRANTSMRAFQMCPACAREYHDPADRRFHAQPNGCPDCGPQVALWDADGRPIAARDEALRHAVEAIRSGLIVAVKGLGGFHLIVDASQGASVARLRERKHRAEKPFAVMFPSPAAVASACDVSAAEARLLASPEAPVVLLRRRADAGPYLSASVAPDNPWVGALLPYTPLHHLLLAEVNRPVVATSGNVSDEPICTDEREAAGRLNGIADLFLVHDRRIVRPIDDSIVRIVLGRELLLRRARGYAPLPVPCGPAGGDMPPLVAVGGHLKTTVAVTSGPHVIVSQHLGDLETPESTAVYRAELANLQALYRTAPAAVACDLHPDYFSTRYARAMGVPVLPIQHHYAHVAATMAENAVEGSALGVAWDGTGYGPDGTIWGGEFLAVTPTGYSRAACLRPFRLPGGDRAVREPRRSALGLLHAMMGASAGVLDTRARSAFSDSDRAVILQALARGLNAPLSTSAGRLFDAVASLIGLRQHTTFEGQSAMALEFAIDERVSDAYPFAILTGPARPSPGGWAAPELVVDWEPAVLALLADGVQAVPAGTMAARFHNTLAEMIVAVAARVGEPRVVLGGGCFQNRYLVERTVACLGASGFRPYWPQRVPPNDGGLAFGQIAACMRTGAVARVEAARTAVEAGVAAFG